MFSIIFFVFVAVVFVAGFLAITWKKRNRVSLDTDVVEERDAGRVPRSSSAFNESSTGDIKGGIVPTDYKLSQNDFDDENEMKK